jgi:hypothetical protein
MNEWLFFLFYIIGLLHLFSGIIAGFAAQAYGNEATLIIFFGPILTLPCVIYSKINKKLSGIILLSGSVISCTGYLYPFIKLPSMENFDFLYFIKFPLMWNLPMIIIGLLFIRKTKRKY